MTDTVSLSAGLSSIFHSTAHIQRCYESLAINTAFLIAYLDQKYDPQNKWVVFRLDHQVSHALGAAATNSRKIFDCIGENNIRGRGQIPIKILKSLSMYDVDEKKSGKFSYYKTCSKISHAYRVSTYSNHYQWMSALGLNRFPSIDRNEEWMHCKLAICESKGHRFFYFELREFLQESEDFLHLLSKEFPHLNLRIEGNYGGL